MALVRQHAAVSLACGLETKLDSKLVPAGKSLVCENVSFVHAGSSTPRYGTETLTLSVSDGSSIAAGVALSTPNADLALQDGSNFYLYGETISQWINFGASVQSVLDVNPVVANNATQTNPVCAATNDVVVVAWTDSRLSSVRYSIRDAADENLFYQNDTLLDVNCSHPQLVSSAGFFFLSVLNDTTGALLVYRLNWQSPAASFVIFTNLTNDTDGVYALSTCTSSSTPSILLANTRASDTSKIDLYVVDSMLGTTTTTTVANAFTTPSWISIAGGTDVYALGVVQPGDVSAYYGNPIVAATTGRGLTLANNLEPQRVTVALQSDDETYFQVYYDYPAQVVAGTPFWSAVSGYTLNYAGIIHLGDSFTQYGLELASQTVCIGSDYPVVCSSPASYPDGTATPVTPGAQTTFFLLRQDGFLLNRFEVETAGGPPDAMLANVVNLSSVFTTALMSRGVLRLDSAGQIFTPTNVVLLQADLADASSCMAVPFDNEEFVNDGKNQVFDGGAMVEAGYNFWPELNVATFTTTNAGSLNTDAVYTWYVVYEWLDFKGRRHYSAPSFPLQGTTTSGSNDASASFFIPYLPLTQRENARGTVQVTVYRSITNSATPAYRVTSYDNVVDGTAGFTFTDIASDASILGQPTMYAQIGGEIENDPPPSFDFVAEGQRRIFGIPQDSRLTVWYSKQRVPGRAPEFSSAFTIRVESTGGDLVGIGALDDAIILFKNRRIYAVQGVGPNALGQPSDGYSSPQLVSSTDGCLYPRSIVKTDQGLWFQGERGITLLDRSLSIKYIGAPMEAYRTLPITGAQLVPAQNQIRFVTSSLTQVYDYLLNQWSTYDYGGVGAAMWASETPAVIAADGTVRTEVSGSYVEGDTGVLMTYRTAWLKPAQMAEGYARVWEIALLGNYLGTHALYFDLFFDYEDTVCSTLTWTPASALNTSVYGADTPYGGGTPYGGTGSTVYQVSARIPKQICQAISIQLRVELASGASCQFNELDVTLGVIGGLNRLPPNKMI